MHILLCKFILTWKKSCFCSPSYMQQAILKVKPFFDILIIDKIIFHWPKYLIICRSNIWRYYNSNHHHHLYTTLYHVASFFFFFLSSSSSSMLVYQTQCLAFWPKCLILSHQTGELFPSCFQSPSNVVWQIPNRLWLPSNHFIIKAWLMEFSETLLEWLLGSWSPDHGLSCHEVQGFVGLHGFFSCCDMQ